MLEPSKTVVTHSNSDSSSKSIFHDFIYGARVPFRAARLLKKEASLRRLAYFPILGSILLYGALLVFFINTLHSWITPLLPHFGAVAGFFYFVFFSLTVAGLIYFAVDYMGVFINLICSPFNDRIARKTEDLILHHAGEPASALQVFWSDFKKTTFLLFCMGVLCLGLLIPGLNLFVAVGFMLVNTMNYISYAQSRRTEGVGRSLVWMSHHFFSALGFGLVMGIVLSMPVLNFLAVPIGVTGGTILYHRR